MKTTLSVLLGCCACSTVATVPAKKTVAGWPDYVAMGAVVQGVPGDTGLTNRYVDAVFKYAGNGAGDEGKVVYPIYTQNVVATAAAVSQDNNHACNPVIVVYTAEMSGGATFTDFDNTNKVLTKHYANLMMISQAMQWTVEYENMTTGSIVMNPDMFGMVQQGGLLPRLMAMDIAVNDALQQAAWFTTTKHTWHLHGTSKPLNISGTHTPMDIMAMVYSGALKSQGVYSPWGVRSSFESECARLLATYSGQKVSFIPSGLTNNFPGWVQSTNWVIQHFSPKLTFGWQENVWNPGSADWVHKDLTAAVVQTNITNPTLEIFSKATLFHGKYQPNFLVFDKYERDPIPTLASVGWVWNARSWDNYMTYVKQMSVGLNNIPVMLWQIPGGHMQTTKEPAGPKQGATSPDYFLGNPDVTPGLTNLQAYETAITLPAGIYKCGKKCTFVEYMNTDGATSQYDWTKGKMQEVADANVFSIMWGGGSTISVGTFPIDDGGWLAKQVNKYQGKN